MDLKQVYYKREKFVLNGVYWQARVNTEFNLGIT
jgi:hypothetical protein